MAIKPGTFTYLRPNNQSPVTVFPDPDDDEKLWYINGHVDALTTHASSLHESSGESP